MKLIEISNKIDKSNRNESYVDVTDFTREFQYDFDYIEQDRLKAYWIGNWYCTDSYVGYRMYFFDGEPVAISSQLGRKSDEEFEWFSEELALKVRDYLISLMIKKEVQLNFDICDPNEEIGDGYKIQFNSQILNPEHACYNGEPVKILERIKETPDWGIDKELKVQLPSGEVTQMNINDLTFRYHVLSDGVDQEANS